jgi:hypothetical protein|tara:strand:+ start:228 stop:461 length:234 start_codon:yes stop_codon:yes gene_type:complete
MESKGMYPPGTVASVNGYHSPTGELLAASPNTQADVDAWNGVTKAPPVTAKSETPPMETIKPATKPAKKKKKAWYKK